MQLGEQIVKSNCTVWRELGWKEWAGVAAGVVVCLFVAAKIFPGFQEVLVSSNTASWVQAIGSIAAVAAVFSVWQAEKRHDVRQANAANVARLQAIAKICRVHYGAIERIMDDLVGLGDAAGRVEAAKNWVDSLTSVLPSLDNVPLHETPYAHVAREFLSFSWGMRLFYEGLHMLAGLEISPDSPVRAASLALVERMKQDAEEMEQAIADISAFLEKYDGE